MTRNTAIRLLLLQTALMILLGWATVYLGRDEFRLFSGREEEEVPTASHVEDEGGMPVVQLSSAAIREVGIEYAKASATELAPQSTVGVTVLDPQPLVELRGRLQAAALDLQAAQAAANASRAEESRVRALFEDDRNASQRAAQQAAARNQVTSEIGKYKALIGAKIRSRTVMPPDLPGNPVVEFNITLLPGGDILDVKLIRSSGHASFDSAVERAIFLSKPLPLPPDPALFNEFRNLNIKVHYRE